MAYDPTATTKNDHARYFVIFGSVATVFLVVLILARLAVLDPGFAIVGVSGTALSVLAMFNTKATDEYTQALWSAGANTGFIAAIAWLLLAPVIEGVWDGLVANERAMAWPVDIGVYIAIGAFLLTFHWKRLRGEF